jgi:hypothetical protein
MSRNVYEYFADTRFCREEVGDAGRHLVSDRYGAKERAVSAKELVLGTERARSAVVPGSPVFCEFFASATRSMYLGGSSYRF